MSPFGSDSLVGNGAVSAIEAPTSKWTYRAFALLAGLLFGYGVSSVELYSFVEAAEHYNSMQWSISQMRLFPFFLVIGAFLGVLLGGQAAEWLGRRIATILFCVFFAIGIVTQLATNNIVGLVIGVLVAGLGAGGVSVTVIIYLSEISSRKLRGILISFYYWGTAIGTFIALVFSNVDGESARRVLVGIQLIWTALVAVTSFYLPETPRYFVKRGMTKSATTALAKARGLRMDSSVVSEELSEIQGNYQYQVKKTGSSWLDCFKGGHRPSENLRRLLIGTCLQLFQQFTGFSFICYAVSFWLTDVDDSFDPRTTAAIIIAVSVCSTPIVFFTVEKVGRRKLLVYGAAIMLLCNIAFVIAEAKDRAIYRPYYYSNAHIASLIFSFIYIINYSITWGPVVAVVTGEIFPLPIRAKGVALSIASSWLGICILLAIILFTDLQVTGIILFSLFSATCFLSMLFVIYCVPETKGLSLEQIDLMFEETNPRTSSKWKPHSRWAAVQEGDGLWIDMERRS